MNFYDNCREIIGSKNLLIQKNRIAWKIKTWSRRIINGKGEKKLLN